MKKSILTINAGSSSIKFALFELALPIPEKASISGLIDGIGTDGVKLVAKNLSGEKVSDEALPGANAVRHKEAFDYLLEWFAGHEKDSEIVAVGHRIVHGGDYYSKPTVLTKADLDRLAMYVKLAPLHQPHNLNGIYTISAALKDIPQVACFDTAFHRTQPRISQIYGLPRKYSDEGIKRYGFHGISYEYISSVLPKHNPRASGRVVVAHLGNGASMTSMQDLKCVSTTLGFSTLDSLIMGTRCGPLDPGIVLYLMDEKKMGFDELTQLFYKESGLLGVSGISPDMRTLTASDSPEAKEAIELFCYRVARELGSLSATIGGLDILVFTGGIGENATIVRQRVGELANWQGIVLDPDANAKNALFISTPESTVDVMVVPTNEEYMIAKHTQALLNL